MNLLRKSQLIVFFFVTFSYGSENVEGPIVTTKSGKIQGIVEQSTNGRNFYTFHKIPFAEPPVGNLRFKNPQIGKPWQGIRDGSEVTIGCPSPELLTYLKDKSAIYEGEEDCLFLSVSTHKIGEELLPVMVFIHGGAFLSVSSSLFQGYDIMNEDIIYVAIDYRLGILGFLSTEDETMPGNLGLKDQTLALQWVQENIKYFGGDPTKVTIFGNSAGGASVHYQVLSPASKGLFSRAILQSGTALCPWTHSEGQKSIAHQVGAAVGCFIPADIGEKQSERLLECLQGVDAEELTMAFKKFVIWNFLPNVFSPYVDGTYLPDQPEILMREGRHNDVDIMIGVTKDDGAWLTESLYYDNDQIERLNSEFDYYGPISLGLNYENSSESIAKTVFNKYLGKLEVTEDNADIVTEMYGHSQFIICSDIVALLHSDNVKSSGKNVYFYQLDYKGKRSLLNVYQIKFGMHWVAHADECFLLFPMLPRGAFTDRDENDTRMRDIFTRLWANFATTGNPTPDESLGFTWDPFTTKSPRHLSIKLDSEMKGDERKEIRKFWSSLPTRQNQWLYGSKENKSKKDKSEL